jgi:aryl-alcohol dehydrogenase-like predicted oxidoreductase
MPSPWKVGVTSALTSAAEASLERLGIETIDLYQIHGPISLRSHEALAEALATAHAKGLVKAVGVSNYSIKETRSIDAALRKRDLRLASNQIEFSLLRDMPEKVGLLDCCRELGVVPLAYSPIGQGRLTGKYSTSNPPPKSRSFSNHPMAAVDKIVAELQRVGTAQGDHTPSQVALAWIIAKGAVPIPGAKNRKQAEDNAGALGWHLSAEDMDALDSVALYGKRGIAQRIWQHG